MSPLLVIETATAACSVALFDGDRLVDERHELVGRGHAERLVPMIAELPDAGRAVHILVDCGPGSFTGIRVGLAAARALGLGWNASVRGYSSLALIATIGGGAEESVTVAIGGGHGEFFVQRYTIRPFGAFTPLRSLPPSICANSPDRLVLGSAAGELVAARGWGEARDVWPRASQAIVLPGNFTDLPPLPIYGRAPDAKLPA